MKVFKTLSEIFILTGVLSSALVILTKQKINWPGFITANITYFEAVVVTLGVLSKLTFYYKSKEIKKFKELLWIWVAMAGIVLLSLLFH